jgi:hypothetical protein
VECQQIRAKSRNNTPKRGVNQASTAHKTLRNSAVAIDTNSRPSPRSTTTVRARICHVLRAGSCQQADAADIHRSGSGSYSLGDTECEATLPSSACIHAPSPRAAPPIAISGRKTSPTLGPIPAGRSQPRVLPGGFFICGRESLFCVALSISTGQTYTSCTRSSIEGVLTGCATALRNLSRQEQSVAQVTGAAHRLKCGRSLGASDVTPCAWLGARPA